MALDVGARIKERRELNMLSMNQLAEDSGVSQGFISDVEAGSKSITVSKLEKICNYLGVSLAEFFSTEISEQPSIHVRYACQRLELLKKDEFKAIMELVELLVKSR